MNDDIKQKVLDICQSWNKREITGDMAMNKIWELYRKDNLREWNKPSKESSEGSEVKA